MTPELQARLLRALVAAEGRYIGTIPHHVTCAHAKRESESCDCGAEQLAEILFVCVKAIPMWYPTGPELDEEITFLLDENQAAVKVG